MYTEDQYKRALSVPQDYPRYKEIQAKVREYQRNNPQANPANAAMVAPAEEAALAPLSEPREEPAGNNVPALPGEAKGATTFGVPEQLDIDPGKDESLPTASKFKAVAKPPEYSPKNPLKSAWFVTKATLADPLDGPAATAWHEPGREMFQADMGDVLAARGITPEGDAESYESAYNEWRDRKWAQAYDKAQAEDRPLRRVAFTDNSGAWKQLRNYVQEGSDVASAFTKGFADGLAPGSADIVSAMGGKELVDSDREQARRNPTAHFVGEVTGAFNPKSAAAKLTAAAHKGARRFLPGMLGDIASGAIGGALGADADLALRSVGQGVADVAAGGTTENAKQQFANHVLTTTGLGVGMGALGTAGGIGLERYRRNLRGGELGGELGNLEAAGGATDIVKGVEPSKSALADIEAARPPVPGEAKARATGTPIEIAAKRVQAPIAEANVRLTEGEKLAAGAEKEAMFDALPEPVQARRTAEDMIEVVKDRAQPEAREGFIPGAKMGLPGRNIGRLREEALKGWKAEFPTTSEELKAALADGGRLLTPKEAAALGYTPPTPRPTMDAEGVPLDAPPLSNPSSSADPVKLLPRYSKEQLANTAQGTATPEQAAAIRRYTFGKREAGDDALVQEFLAQAPVSPLPNMYRGLVLSPEQASELLASKGFNINDVARGGSVSADPIVARSFVARNLNKPGDVGVTLKLEHQSARDIRHLADPQVAVEGEHMIPDAQFEIVSKHKDASNPGNWIVVAKEVPRAPTSKPGSVRDILGPADKPSPATGKDLGPRAGRAKPPPAPEPGSDWDNPSAAKARFDFMYEGLPEGTGAPGVPDDITPTRVSHGSPIPMPPRSKGAPSSAPPELQATPPEALPPVDATSGGDIPDGEFRVVMKPRSYNARDFDDIVKAFDDAAKEGTSGVADPAWERWQASVRADREQFGPELGDMYARHHATATAREQQAGHANLRGGKPYPEMPANDQKAYNAGLVNYGAAGTPEASNVALRELAKEAGVLKELDNLRATRATLALRDKAAPAISESAGMGGMFARVGGLGPAVKLRLDSAARAGARGATGERLDVKDISPELLRFVRENAPAAVEGGKVNPFMRHLAVGGGALGLKAGSVYDVMKERRGANNTLTPEEQRFLDQLLTVSKQTLAAEAAKEKTQ